MGDMATVAQSSAPGELVSLFRFDARPLGGSDMYFTQARFESANVFFGGIEYTPVDCEFTGLEVSGSGTLPAPRIRIANTNGIFQSLVNTYGDLLGCTVQRIRTWRQFLDGQPQADPSAYYGPDTFRIERKVDENPIFIEWELSASIDQEGKLLPGRQVIRDTCLWRYRAWDPQTLSFNYNRVQCPYVGTNYFDRQGLPTTAPNDVCGRRVSDCKLRFGANAALPFGGFPGIGRVRA